MKKLSAPVFLFLLCCAVSMGARAQNAKEDFMKVNRNYSAATELGMKIHFALFSDYNGTTPFEVQDGSYLKKGTNFYSDLMGIKTIQNSETRLTVNENDKTIIVSDPLKSSKNPSEVNLDSILSKCSDVVFTDAGQGEKLYRLRFDKTSFFEFDIIDIRIGSDSYIKKLILYYREAVSLDETNSGLKKEKPRLEITYNSITTSPVIEQDQFSEKKYIAGSGKKTSLLPAFATYRLLNLKQ
ncbi:MAG: hypothetical protein M3R17_13805 [Bacteroidota bacterium]|nr:hypothetical protein [Bacteroidota bacterium]